MVNWPNSVPSPNTPEVREELAAPGSSARAGEASFQDASASSEARMRGGGLGFQGHGDSKGGSPKGSNRGATTELRSRGGGLTGDGSVSRGSGQASAHRLQRASMPDDDANQQQQQQQQEQQHRPRKRRLSFDLSIAQGL
eukprot:1151027-Pelagomonas_calceolata.AAC.7